MELGTTNEPMESGLMRGGVSVTNGLFRSEADDESSEDCSLSIVAFFSKNVGVDVAFRRDSVPPYMSSLVVSIDGLTPPPPPLLRRLRGGGEPGGGDGGLAVKRVCVKF